MRSGVSVAGASLSAASDRRGYDHVSTDIHDAKCVGNRLTLIISGLSYYLDFMPSEKRKVEEIIDIIGAAKIQEKDVMASFIIGRYVLLDGHREYKGSFSEARFSIRVTPKPAPEEELMRR